MYAAYDDTEIGALDCDEIEGYIAPDSELVFQCAAEFEQQQTEGVSISKVLVSKKSFIIVFL